MTEPRRRVALYARVSTDDQDPELQLRELRSRFHGHDVREFVDRGESGAKRRRPELDKLMSAIDAAELDVVAVWKFDRLARSTRHLLELLDELRGRGVGFVSVTESVDTTTAAGRAMFTVIAAFAEFEREQIRERVRSGMAAAAANGVHCGRPQRWTDEQVRRARELRAAGRSWRSIAQAVGLPVRTLRRALECDI